MYPISRDFLHHKPRTLKREVSSVALGLAEFVAVRLPNIKIIAIFVGLIFYELG